MNDDCGQCPMCGEALIISKNNKLLYECSNARCTYVEFLYHNADKGKKFAGGKKMDITEKWNKIVDHYTENINTLECDIQKAWVDFFADTDFFGYSKFNKEVDDQRSIQIGSTQRVIPDIIIRSNQEQHDLFVVELKRYSKMEGHSQLFSYLKLLNLNIGVLVCSKLYIYDYDIVNTNDEQAFIEIAFEKDNPDGIKFMELFSKSTFNQQEVKDYIQKRNKEMKNIHTIQQKVTTDYVKKLLQEHFAATYSQTEIEQALKEIVITVGKKVAVPVIPPAGGKAAPDIKPAGAKDNTQYSVDGNITGGKCPTAYAVVSKYISMYPTISYSELYNIFPDEAGKPGFGKCIRLPQDVTEAQWNGNRFNKHPLHLASGEQVVVSTQWTPDNFNSFIQYATKAGIEIKPV